MRNTQNYSFRLPEREPERNDPADINDLTFNWENADSVARQQAEELARTVKDLAGHKAALVLDHPDGCVTDRLAGKPAGHGRRQLCCRGAAGLPVRHPPIWRQPCDYGGGGRCGRRRLRRDEYLQYLAGVNRLLIGGFCDDNSGICKRP